MAVEGAQNQRRTQWYAAGLDDTLGFDRMSGKKNDVKS